MAEDLLRLVGYCGCYCGLCGVRVCFPKHAKRLKDTLQQEGMDYWYRYVPSMRATFPVFWKFLEDLTRYECSCRSGGGPSTCKIRLCAKKKGISVCPFCDQYPCTLIENYNKVYPTTIEDGKRLKEIGLEAWVKEQEERAEKGFIYAHIKITRKDITWA
jgi:hypothetical protein